MGSRAVFTRVVTDEKRSRMRLPIWMVATSAMKIRAHDQRQSMTRTPAGHRMAGASRLSAVEEKDDSGKPRPPQIPIRHRCLAAKPVWLPICRKGTASPVWSLDSKRIAFLVFDHTGRYREGTPQEAATRRQNGGRKHWCANRRESAVPAIRRQERTRHQTANPDIHIITRAVYRDNDEGYLDFKRHEHVWLIDVTTASDEPAKPVQLTSGDYDEGDVFWTHDSSRIYFLTTRIDEPYYETPSTDVYPISSAQMPGGTPEKLATIPMGIGDLAPQP